MLRKIFFDFDGTLIDSSQRMYDLFSKLVVKNHLDYDEYWKIKRRGIVQKEVLEKYFKYTPSEILYFKENWISQIENSEFLKSDMPFENSSYILNELSKNNELYLVTARQCKEGVINQLQKFNLFSYFKNILVTHQKISKSDLILKNVENIREMDIMIGDTGEDIESAKKLGIISCAVSTGNVDQDILRLYNPDLIYNNIKEFYDETI